MNFRPGDTKRDRTTCSSHPRPLRVAMSRHPYLAFCLDIADQGGMHLTMSLPWFPLFPHEGNGHEHRQATSRNADTDADVKGAGGD